MKYLITGLPGSTPIPLEQGAGLLGAGMAWIKSKLADGTIDCHYKPLRRWWACHPKRGFP